MDSILIVCSNALFESLAAFAVFGVIGFLGMAPSQSASSHSHWRLQRCQVQTSGLFFSSSRSWYLVSARHSRCSMQLSLLQWMHKRRYLAGVLSQYLSSYHSF